MESSKAYIRPPLWKITNIITGEVSYTDNAHDALWAANDVYSKPTGYDYPRYIVEPYDSPAARVLYSPKTDNE